MPAANLSVRLEHARKICQDRFGHPAANGERQRHFVNPGPGQTQRAMQWRGRRDVGWDS
jgi:hypothetical protein